MVDVTCGIIACLSVPDDQGMRIFGKAFSQLQGKAYESSYRHQGAYKAKFNSVQNALERGFSAQQSSS